MYIKGFLLVLSVIIYLGSVSVLSAGDIQLDSDAKAAADHLTDYYDEFNHSVAIIDYCNCDLDLNKQQDSLNNYYSEFLK